VGCRGGRRPARARPATLSAAGEMIHIGLYADSVLAGHRSAEQARSLQLGLGARRPEPAPPPAERPLPGRGAAYYDGMGADLHRFMDSAVEEERHRLASAAERAPPAAEMAPEADARFGAAAAAAAAQNLRRNVEAGRALLPGSAAPQAQGAHGAPNASTARASVLRHLGDMAAAARKAADRYDARNRPASFMDRVLADPRQSSVPWGEEATRLARSYLYNLKVGDKPLKWSEPQRLVLEGLLEMSMPHFYGRDYERYRTDLLRRAKRKDTPRILGASYARQGGKSTIAAGDCSANLLVTRGTSTLLIATNLQVSGQMLREVYTFLVAMLGGDTRRILVANTRVICVQRPDCLHLSPDEAYASGMYNIIRACSSSADGSRGFRANFIFVDEASFVKEKFVKEMIAPIMKVGWTVLAVFSTVKDPRAWFSRLIVGGTNLHRELVISYVFSYVCADCRRRNALRCVHLEHLQPAHNSADGDGPSRLLMGDDTATYRQEVLGELVMSGDSGRVLRGEWLQAQREQKRVPIRSLLPMRLALSTFVDPKGPSHSSGSKGPQSRLAALSYILTPGNTVGVAGMDACADPGHNDQLRFLSNYFAALAELPGARTMPHELFVEHNYGGTAWPAIVLVEARKHLPQTELVMRQLADGRLVEGVWTGANRAPAIDQFVIDVQRNNLFFFEEWVCINAEARRERVYDEWEAEMLGLSVERNGRVSGKAGGNADDMAIGLILGIDCARRRKKSIQLSLSERCSNAFADIDGDAVLRPSDLATGIVEVY
jgi:hypothetical protein